MEEISRFFGLYRGSEFYRLVPDEGKFFLFFFKNDCTPSHDNILKPLFFPNTRYQIKRLRTIRKRFSDTGIQILPSLKFSEKNTKKKKEVNEKQETNKQKTKQASYTDMTGGEKRVVD